LIHGLAAQADVNWRWTGVGGKLRKEFRVITLDLRGHGLSSKPHDPAKYGVEMVKDVARLMDHLKIPRAHVAGYSMGGFITLKFLEMYPDRLISATSCAAGWEQPGAGGLDRLHAAVSAIEAGEGMTPVLKLLAPTNKRLSEWQFHQRARIIERMSDMQAIMCVVKSFADLAVPEATLRSNMVPLSCIVGEFDPLRKGVEALKELAPSCETIFIPGGDHFSTPRKSAFADALLKCLQEHRTTPQPAKTPVAYFRGAPTSLSAPC
jgi:pimeloyl-ACP methyl ester carboxylesterase